MVADFAQAYSTLGFGYITGHGIAQSDIDAVFAQSRAFHALPETDKQAISLDQNHRGYIAINTSTDVTSELATVTKPNQSASFMMMREDDMADPAVYLSGPNQWPNLPGFRTALDRYVVRLSRLGRRLMHIAAQAAGADPADILPAFDTPTLWLRLLHYPPHPPQAAGDLFGSAPHCDFGALTLLAQDRVGGLQVMKPDGNWVDAPPLPGSFVVNVGDMLHRMSNGFLKSTPHRVINRSGQERYSCPFFFDPHVSTKISPLPGTGAPKFAPLNFSDFLRNELEASYAQHQTETTHL